MAGEGKKVTKGDKTKKLLYDCAMELFREKGYDQVSVAEIVKKAGTAKGTFYIYFASKPEVLFEMLREYDDYYDQVASRFPETLSVQGRLEKIAMSAGEFTSTVIGFDLIRVLYTGQMTGNLRAQLYTDRSLYRIIREELRDPRIRGTWSITRAEVTRDLRYAKIYISVLEEELAPDLLAALKNAASYLRRSLGKQMLIRYTPELLFVSDRNIEYGVHIAQVLAEARKNESSAEEETEE